MGRPDFPTLFAEGYRNVPWLGTQEFLWGIFRACYALTRHPPTPRGTPKAHTKEPIEPKRYIVTLEGLEVRHVERHMFIHVKALDNAKL